MKDIKKQASELASYGRNGDTLLAHITPKEAEVLSLLGGSGTTNPDTGLPEYWGFNPFKAVTNIVSNIVSPVVDVVKDIGSSVDDLVNDVVPFGWAGLAAATGMYFAPEIAAIANAAETTALAEGATAADAATAGLNAATAADAAASTATTDYLGSTALGDATTGAVGTGATGVGLSTDVVGTGINTGALGGTEWLGGAGTLPVGTAGLTAEQIAQSQLAGQVGSTAASGTGYLGGTTALDAGTAGLTGVEATSPISIQQALRGANLLQSLTGQQSTVPTQGMRNIKPYGSVDYSGILSLLEQQAKRPNILSLLG